MPQTPPDREVIEALQENWRAEVQSARMYRELAEHEREDKRKAVLLRMAEAEERHAARWEKKLREHGVEPSREDTWRQRLNRWFSRQAGTAAAIRRMEAAEERDSARYSAQRDRALGADREVNEILGGIALEEDRKSTRLNSSHSS